MGNSLVSFSSKNNWAAWTPGQQTKRDDTKCSYQIAERSYSYRGYTENRHYYDCPLLEGKDHKTVLRISELKAANTMAESGKYKLFSKSRTSRQRSYLVPSEQYYEQPEMVCYRYTSCNDAKNFRIRCIG